MTSSWHELRVSKDEESENTGFLEHWNFSDDTVISNTYYTFAEGMTKN